MRLQITTTLRNAQNFDECYAAWRTLRNNFELVDSTTMISTESYYDDEQDEMDDLEMEARDIFASDGSIEEVEFEQVED